MASFRYYKFDFTGGNNTSIMLQEIQLVEVDTLIVRSEGRGASVTADGQSHYPYANTVDGSLATHWQHNAPYFHWWKIDLGAAYELGEYRLVGAYQNAYNPTAWTFRGSNDNSNWTVIDTKSNQVLGAGVSYTYPTSYFVPRYLSGTVKDGSGNFVKRLVRAFRFSDGALGGESFSSPSTGEFSVQTRYKEKHSVVVYPWDAFYTYLPLNGLHASTVIGELGGSLVKFAAGGSLSTTQSKFGGSSAYLSAGGRIEIYPTAKELEFGSGDFTIEFWVRPDSVSVTQTLFDGRPQGVDGICPTIDITAAGNIELKTTAVVRISGAHGMPAAAWSHIALCRLNGISKIFVNGVQKGADYTDANVYASYPGRPVIGCSGFSVGTVPYAGYVDDVRITKGKAQYLSNFNVPTVAHFTEQAGDPYWNNVVFGCHFDGQPDNGDAHRNSVVLNMRMNGTNGSTAIVEDTGKVVTVAGNAQLSTSVKKYGTASLALDGAGDYLSLVSSDSYNFGAADFTIEAWVYLVAAPTGGVYPAIVSKSGTASTYSWRLFFHGDNNTIYGGVSANGTTWTYVSGPVTTASIVGTWAHIAFVRSSAGLRVFVNGVSNSLSTAFGSSSIYAHTNPVNVGRFAYDADAHYFNGYIDDLRITKGVARYTADFTPPAAELPPLQLAFKEVSSGKVITAYGDAKISATQSKFGGYSAYFDGVGDYISVPDSSDFAFGNSDFAFDCWIRVAGSIGTQYDFLSQGTDASGLNWTFRVSTTGKVAFAVQHTSTVSSVIRSTTVLTTGVWYHVAVSRVSGVLKLFVNGVSEDDGSAVQVTNAFPDVANPVLIGAFNNSGAFAYFNGHIDDLRITKGVGRQFNAVPTAAFPEQLQTFGQQNAMIFDHLTPV